MNKLTITSTAQLRQALEQFYAATATPEVIEALTDYFSTHPQVDAEFEADRAIILAMAEAASIEEPDDMEQRILAATCGSPRRTMWRRIRLWHVAASAVAVFAIASLWLFQPNSDAVADTSLIAKADTVATIQPQPPGDLELIAHLVEQLPPNSRLVMRMSIYDNKPSTEIAAITGLSNDNVRQIISRSRLKIKQLYQKLKQ